MATSAPPQPLPGSSSVSAPQPPPAPPHTEITWDGDKMFNIYILDYCKKRGYHKTANQLVTEADIPPESKPPINAQQGLLFEWWSVFWVLFQAKNSGNGSEDAMLYHKHQNLKLRGSQVPPPGVPQPQARYTLSNGAGPVPPLPNPHLNGIPVGQPQSLSAPPYGHAHTTTQPNGMHPTAPPGPPGPPFPGAMVGRPALGPQQRPPPSQYQSPTIAPSPQSQGNPQQPPQGPMGQLGRSPHLSTISRANMPPPTGPQHLQGPGPPGSAHHTPTPPYQVVRPASSHSHDNSSQHPMNPHPSPALSGRIPPGQDRSPMDNALDAELATYPPELVGEAKLRAGVGEKDAQSLTVDEKQHIIQHATRLKQSQAQNSGVAGPSGVNMHGQLPNRGSIAQPMQQQLSMHQQRVAKRNSTSPGEEHQTLPRNDQSPPDRKRPRRTPNPAEQQQQQQPPQQQQPQSQQQQQQQHQSQPQPPPTPQQQHQAPQQPQQQPQQPPMAPMGPLPSGSHMSGAAGVRGHIPMPGQVIPNGFGPPIHQMGPGPMSSMHAMSPGMAHGPPLGVINPQQMGPSQVLYSQNQYRAGLMSAQHKGNPNIPAPGGPGDLQSQPHLRAAPGLVPNRLTGPLVPPQPGQPPKAMGGPMLPPGQTGMNGPPKPAGKEGEGEHNNPHNPSGSAPTPTPHLNPATPMNPQRPQTASSLPTPAPGPEPGSMSELSFDMTDMFGNSGGDFDFGPDGLSNMELWFDPTAVHGSSLDMK